MALSLTTKQKVKGPLERAKINIETIANNLYYTLTLSNYIMKLQSVPLPIHLTIDELIENNYVVGNLVAADSIIQQAQMISA